MVLALLGKFAGLQSSKTIKKKKKKKKSSLRPKPKKLQIHCPSQCFEIPRRNRGPEIPKSEPGWKAKSVAGPWRGAAQAASGAKTTMLRDPGDISARSVQPNCL